jgi:hypothetical protein
MISQMELLGAIFTELDRQGVKSLVSRQTNAIIAAANDIIAQCEREPVMTTDGMGLKRWLASDDTGASSCYMASVLGGFDRPYAHPHDLGDFGRCSRLLVAVPEFRERLGEMRSKSPRWSRLVDAWESIESLMVLGKHEDANRLVMDAVSSR